MAIVSEKNVGKIHVFSSETQYTNNKSKMSDNDIAMVKLNLIDQLKGNSSPVLTPLCDWDRMKTLNGGTDVRNYSDSTTGLKSYGGDSSFPDVSGGTSRKGTILLKQSYLNFDKLLVIGSDDSALYCLSTIWDIWDFKNAMNMGGAVSLFNVPGSHWYIRPHTPTGMAPLSTTTAFFIYDQNASIVEIYGVTYTN